MILQMIYTEVCFSDMRPNLYENYQLFKNIFIKGKIFTFSILNIL